MKPQPPAVTQLEQRAKLNSQGRQPGYAEADGVRCHYYPRSKTYTFWIFSVRRPKAAVIEHFRFQDVFRRATPERSEGGKQA